MDLQWKKDKMPEIFSRSRNNIFSNKVTEGRNESERIDSICIFTGQSFIAPKNATIITSLNDDYEILLPTVAWEFSDNTPRMSGIGLANGAYMQYGKGRLIPYFDCNLR